MIFLLEKTIWQMVQESHKQLLSAWDITVIPEHRGQPLQAQEAACITLIYENIFSDQEFYRKEVAY